MMTLFHFSFGADNANMWTVICKQKMKSMRLEILEILSQKIKDHLNRKNYRSLLLCDIQSCVLQSNFQKLFSKRFVVQYNTENIERRKR